MNIVLKRIGLAAMLGALSVSLVACGNDPTPTVPAATAQPTSASATSTTVVGSTDDTNTDSTQPTATTATTDSTTATAAAAKLNLNTVTEAELMSTIPDFPSRMVREFQEYRPYSSIQQFRKEIGKYVDASQVTEWEKYVYVPVDPNNSDAETLMQLPGVDQTIAESLISGRPYASTGAFFEALGKQISADQLAQAKTYLATE